jgi:hypothetical protein
MQRWKVRRGVDIANQQCMKKTPRGLGWACMAKLGVCDSDTYARLRLSWSSYPCLALPRHVRFNLTSSLGKPTPSRKQVRVKARKYTNGTLPQSMAFQRQYCQ